MLIKTANANLLQLAWLVAICENIVDNEKRGIKIDRKTATEPASLFREVRQGSCMYCDYSPADRWAQGGPIVEREGLTITYWGERSKFGQHEKKETFWECRHPSHRTHSCRTVGYGPTPLIAAMRCFIASRLGDEMEVPDELC